MNDVVLGSSRRAACSVLDVTRRHLVLPEWRFASGFVPPTGLAGGPETRVGLRVHCPSICAFRPANRRFVPETLVPDGVNIVQDSGFRFLRPLRNCAHADTSTDRTDRGEAGSRTSGLGTRDSGFGVRGSGDSGDSGRQRVRDVRGSEGFVGV